MKKIISFSLFGNKTMYTIGAIKNVKLQKKIYPDWICRFYIHSPTVPKNIIDELRFFNCEIILKTEPLITKSFPGMFWRFEVLKDKSVERFIVRDTDSRLSERDKICVDEWENSKKNFHIIRDHPTGHGSRIMGGMWGATKKVINKLDYDILYAKFRFYNEYDIEYTIDQDFLVKLIYPLIKNDACIHDNYHFFEDEEVLRIPHKRTNRNFIGRIIKI